MSRWIKDVAQVNSLEIPLIRYAALNIICLMYLGIFKYDVVSWAQNIKPKAPTFSPVTPNDVERQTFKETQREQVPKRPPDESGPIRGLTTIYGSAGSAFSNYQLERCDPSGTDCSKPNQDSRFALIVNSLVGWGPLRTDYFSFNVHYKYSQNWSSTADQWRIFQTEWSKTKKAGDFLFPTKDLLRVHEIASDNKVLLGDAQFGLFARLTWGRVGSGVFGDDRILEKAETVVKTENFIPYASYKYGNNYRVQISLPFRTEVNVEDKRLSNASYSWSSKGRGFLLSSKLSNEFYFLDLDSILKVEVYFYRYKYATLQNDRDRPGFSAYFDFPITRNVRAIPNITWHQDGFSVQRPRIDNFRKGASEVNIPATLVTPKNNYLAFGLSGFWDITKRSRIDFTFTQEATTSNIPEFNLTQTQWQLGYSWSFPSAKSVVKKTQRFVDDGFSEEF